MVNPRQETVWVTDLDRTLLDTNRAFELLLIAASEYGVSRDELLARKSATEIAGGSFDACSYLLQQLGEEDLEEVYRDFIFLGTKEDLLYSDARPYLEALDITHTPHMVLTYGTSDWQAAKLEAAHLDSRPHMITNQKAKGHLIARWRQEGMTLPSSYKRTGQLVVRHNTQVNLVDDKADSFEGLPSDCQGFLIERGSLKLPSQEGDLPENVSACYGLDELVGRITMIASQVRTI
jgi:hypothetical protein